MCISLSFCLVCEYATCSHHNVQSNRSSPNNGCGIKFTAIRFSWRLRRSSRHVVGKGGHSSGKAGAGHDKEVASVYLNVQQPDEHLDETSQHSTSSTLRTPGRTRSQRRREREPPVIIGDPTVSLLSESGRKTGSKANAVMMIYAVIFIVHPIPVVGRMQDANVLAQEALHRTSSRMSGRVEVSRALSLPGPRDFRSSPAVPFGMTTIRSILHR